MKKSISGAGELEHTAFGKVRSACLHLSQKSLDFDADLSEVFINHDLITVLVD